MFLPVWTLAPAYSEKAVISERPINPQNMSGAHLLLFHPLELLDGWLIPAARVNLITYVLGTMRDTLTVGWVSAPIVAEYHRLPAFSGDHVHPRCICFSITHT